MIKFRSDVNIIILNKLDKIKKKFFFKYKQNFSKNYEL